MLQRVSLLRLVSSLVAVVVSAFVVALSAPSPCEAWVSTPLLMHPASEQQRTSSLFPNTRRTTIAPPSLQTKLFAAPDDNDDDDDEVVDYTGKKVFQRTYYRLTGAVGVSHPNALILEERLEYRPTSSTTLTPHGPRLLILREGTDEERIPDELYRLSVGSSPHTGRSGSRSLDTTLATALYCASNPQWMQGDVLQLDASSSGSSTHGVVAGLLGALGARFALDPTPVTVNIDESKNEEDNSLLAGGESTDTVLFPPRMKGLTLAEDGEDGYDRRNSMMENDTLQQTLRPFLRNQKHTPIRIKPVGWSKRIPNRHYDHFYRMIVGNDIDFQYPTAKELARTVAHYLLPSNEFAVSSIKNGSDNGRGGSGGTFGAMGMEMEGAPSSPPQSSSSSSSAEDVDTTVPSLFCHVSPEQSSQDAPYLRQFLEKGFNMNVRSDFFQMERLQFALECLPSDAPSSDLDLLEYIDLEQESVTSYQALLAVHSDDYGGDGTGEYFFPLETGAYEGGGGASRSAYMEPDEGGTAF